MRLDVSFDATDGVLYASYEVDGLEYEVKRRSAGSADDVVQFLYKIAESIALNVVPAGALDLIERSAAPGAPSSQLVQNVAPEKMRDYLCGCGCRKSVSIAVSVSQRMPPGVVPFIPGHGEAPEDGGVYFGVPQTQAEPT